MILVPVVGALIIGLLARYGSERIRGHGIPEAIEAILINGSRVQPRVAVLKPLSSAISIGSGGPFGAEGPIIMTGGAFGSLIAQFFHLTRAERKTLLVAGVGSLASVVRGTPVVARPDEPLRVIVHRMPETGITRFPVVDGESQKLVGIVSLADLLKARALNLDAEQRRERVLGTKITSPFGRARKTA